MPSWASVQGRLDPTERSRPLTAGPPAFFIFGGERGGTTLLAALLSEHPAVHVVNDSFVYLAFAEAWNLRRAGVLRRLRGRLSWTGRDLLRRAGPLHRLALRLRARMAGGYRPVAPALDGLPAGRDRPALADVTAFLDRLRARYLMFQPDERGNSFLRDHARALDSHRPAARAAAGELTVAELLAGVIVALVPADRRPRPLLGEKTPRHLYCSPWMRRVHPSARVITLVRHPLSNVAALHQRMGRDLDGALAKYLSFHADRFADLYAGPDVLVVRYEDLLARPAESLARIQDHLRLDTPFEPRVDAGTRAAYVGNAIDPRRDHDRRQYFTGQDRRTVLERCAAIIDRHYAEPGS